MDIDASHLIPHDAPYRTVLLSLHFKLPRKAQISYNIYKIYISNETRSLTGSNKTQILTLLLLAQISSRDQIEVPIEVSVNTNQSQESWFPCSIVTNYLAGVARHRA